MMALRKILLYTTNLAIILWVRVDASSSNDDCSDLVQRLSNGVNDDNFLTVWVEDNNKIFISLDPTDVGCKVAKAKAVYEIKHLEYGVLASGEKDWRDKYVNVTVSDEIHPSSFCLDLNVELNITLDISFRTKTNSEHSFEYRDPNRTFTFKTVLKKTKNPGDVELAYDQLENILYIKTTGKGSLTCLATKGQIKLSDCHDGQGQTQATSLDLDINQNNDKLGYIDLTGIPEMKCKETAVGVTVGNFFGDVIVSEHFCSKVNLTWKNNTHVQVGPQFRGCPNVKYEVECSGRVENQTKNTEIFMGDKMEQEYLPLKEDCTAKVSISKTKLLEKEKCSVGHSEKCSSQIISAALRYPRFSDISVGKFGQKSEFQIKNALFLEKINKLSPYMDGMGHLSAPTKSGKELLEGTSSSQAVAIQVENYSNKLLGDPRHHVRCGWPVSGFETPNIVKHSSRDVFLYHDRGWGAGTKTCGSISWQILKSDGTSKGLPYKNRDNKGLRLALTWNIYEGAWCGANIQNEITLNIFENNVDEEGKWKKPTQDEMYKPFHKTHSIKLCQHKQFSNTPICLSEIPPSFKARATIENGCKALVKLQLLGEGEAAMEVENSAEVVIVPGADTMTNILILAGIVVASLVVVIGAIKGVEHLRKKNKHKSDQPVTQSS